MQRVTGMVRTPGERVLLQAPPPERPRPHASSTHRALARASRRSARAGPGCTSTRKAPGVLASAVPAYLGFEARLVALPSSNSPTLGSEEPSGVRARGTTEYKPKPALTPRKTRLSHHSGRPRRTGSQPRFRAQPGKRTWRALGGSPVVSGVRACGHLCAEQVVTVCCAEGPLL